MAVRSRNWRPNPPLVLLIEDDPDTRAVIEILLAQSGFDVLAAMDGLEGIERARTEAPDVILLDLLLPWSDGWQVLAMLRRRPAAAHIPVIALTALQRGVVESRQGINFDA